MSPNAEFQHNINGKISALMLINKFLKKIGFYTFITLTTATFFFAVGVWWPSEQAQPVKTNRPIVIRNVSVIDLVVGNIRPNQTILIDEKKILFVGSESDVSIPKNSLEIDGTGQFAMPGLWDMHTHLYKVTPLLDLPLYIAYGVTNVRDMSSCPKKGDPFVPCPEDLREWNRAAINDELIGPRIQGISSWLLNGPGIHNYMKGLPDFFGTANPQQAKEFAHFYADKVDAIKVYDYIPKESYFALVNEAKKVGLDVIGHRPFEVSAIEAAQHQKSIEHARFILHESFSGSKKLRESVAKGLWKEDRRAMLDEHDPKMAIEIFEVMRANGTWYVPTHLTRRVDAYGDDPLILNDPILNYLHPIMKWQWLEDVNKTIDEDPSPEARQTYKDFYKKGLELTGQAHSAGVKILAGSDYIVAGVTVHNELQQLVLAGLTPLDALRAATIYPVEYFGLQNDYGQIQIGMNADILLLNKNPLVNIENSLTIDTVIFNGNYYDRQALDELDKLVVTRARSWSIACKILWEYIKNPVGY